MHPQLEQFLRNIGLDADTPPPDKPTWQAFLHLLQRDYAQHSPLPTTPPVPEGDVSFAQRLATERDKLKAVIAALDKGLCVFDLHGRLQLLNAAAKNFFLDLTPLNGENLLARFHVHDPLCNEYLSAADIIQRISEGCSLHDGNAELVNSDGGLLPMSFTLTPLVSQKHIIGAVLLFEDISRHKHIEAALVAAKEAAEQASAAKSEFMTSMSHELRTPMNAILGYGDILLEELDDAHEHCGTELIEDFQTSIHNIINAGRTLLGLINGVLDLSRLENGKMEIHIERTELSALVAQRLEAWREDILKKEICLTNHIQSPAYAFADPVRLAQVLDHLLHNAIKYNHHHGSISVKIVQNRPDYIRILVQDSGIGISAEQQTQIFQPFVRMSGRNLTVGTGIGLTVSKHLLEVMDGSIGLESVPDQGSTFWIDLPTGARQTQQGSEARKYLLLYIEDSRTNVGLVAKLLKARPELALISAPSGEMGVELARLHHPDIILLDINLPGIDGFEVLKRIKATAQHIPVIGLSADDSPEALAQAQTVGFYDYMIKPLNKQKFLNTLNVLMNASSKN
jgi:PAS domain S-box-containing protein